MRRKLWDIFITLLIFAGAIAFIAVVLGGWFMYSSELGVGYEVVVDVGDIGELSVEVG